MRNQLVLFFVLLSIVVLSCKTVDRRVYGFLHSDSKEMILKLMFDQYNCKIESDSLGRVINHYRVLKNSFGYDSLVETNYTYLPSRVHEITTATNVIDINTKNNCDSKTAEVYYIKAGGEVKRNLYSERLEYDQFGNQIKQCFKGSCFTSEIDKVSESIYELKTVRGSEKKLEDHILYYYENDRLIGIKDQLDSYEVNIKYRNHFITSIEWVDVNGNSTRDSLFYEDGRLKAISKFEVDFGRNDYNVVWNQNNANGRDTVWIEDAITKHRIMVTSYTLSEFFK